MGKNINQVQNMKKEKAQPEKWKLLQQHMTAYCQVQTGVMLKFLCGTEFLIHLLN